ncbi:gag-pol polyprotein [Tanacetum coccineum]
MQEVISYYKGLDVPTRKILDSKGVIPSMKVADAKKAIQDMDDHSKKWHNGMSTRCRSTETSDGLAAIQAQLNNLGREIKKVNEKVYAAQIGYKATIPFPSHLYDDCYDEEEGSYGLKDLDTYLIRTTLLDDALPNKEKDPMSFTLPCIINNLCFNKALAELGASISVIPFSTYTNLGLGKLAPTKLIVELADRTMKHPKGIAENVLVGIDKFVFPVDFIVLDMPKDIKTPLILGRPFLSTVHAKIDVSLDPLYGDYIKLNDLNEPLELKRHQVDDLVPTIKEGEVVDEPMMDIVKTRCDNEIVDGLDEYLSYCDFDRKIHIDCAYNLQFSCMIGYEHVNANFFPLLDAYIKARRFDGIITIYKGNDSVTYQMARSHPGFKHLTDAQCNKMRPLLKVSTHDELKGISHPYQKLKGFYKEVLNLGSEYIKNEKVEEWLTRGHAFWSLNKEISRYCSDNLYVVSIKEDTAYLCLHFTRNHEELKSNTPYPEDSYVVAFDLLRDALSAIFGLSELKKTAKQSTTVMSSTEAEYIDAAKASMEAVWMRKVYDGLWRSHDH